MAEAEGYTTPETEGLACVCLAFQKVPPTRRFSHDETDMWISDQIPSYLHHWGSTEDMMVTALYSSSLPHPGRRRSSLVSYHEESPRRHHHPHPHPPPHGTHSHRKPRRSSSEDSAHGLRQLPRVAAAGEHYGDELGCFSRDEVVNFIDETPLPSPGRSPRHHGSSSAATAQLAVLDGTASSLLLPHFKLTDFEREPQVLRRLSEHKRGSAPLDGTPRGGGGGQRQFREDRQQRGRPASPGQGQRGAGHSSSKAARTGQQKGPGGEGRGSVNSFVGTPSASFSSSSGHIAFPSDCVGSTT
ncbi:hypothetical protein NHX12_012549 [Muraenolepis orangiensis]|uniref:Uncharacterized protein n=1 Tax=Muraenolepis orangiensis TaxID=630683 RepID=A0A9Q0DCV1_9TELE|nr:hypothetical protein NHX12_012549 [Muraenolepis orangiensis]